MDSLGLLAVRCPAERREARLVPRGGRLPVDPLPAAATRPVKIPTATNSGPATTMQAPGEAHEVRLVHDLLRAVERVRDLLQAELQGSVGQRSAALPFCFVLGRICLHLIVRGSVWAQSAPY